MVKWMNNIRQEHYKPKPLNSHLFLLTICWFVISCQQPKSTITEGNLTNSWSASQVDGKPIFVDFYTDWCSPCKIMDKEVYSDAEIGDYLREHYHAIKFNPEKVQTVEAFDTLFMFDDGLGVNSFLYFATKNRFRGYPTAVILTKDGDLLWMNTGTMTKGEMLKALKEHAVN